MRIAVDEPSHETERALRGLLEDVVPQAAAPPDRMDRIRRLVRRRRSRRLAAAGTAAAVAALVACVTVVPGPRPGGGTDQRYAVPAVPPSPGPTRDLATVRLLEPAGLNLRVPSGWRSLSVDDRGTVTDFVSSQPLTAPAQGSCPHPQDGGLFDCVPLGGLERDGVLVAFRFAGTGKAGRATPLAVGRPARAGKSCRVLRGDTEVAAWGYGRSAAYNKPFEVRISACLRQPSGETLTLLDNALRGAFPATGG
ncbi:hypothetical protein [Streptomyces sp. NPDC026673]|uniref:hypothetical protein n=1 Tax=Streptomyces sp. NPDC026673 TaxID=3155724 RepID=UPI0033EFE232